MRIKTQHRQVFWNGLIILTSICAIYLAIFSLIRGIVDVFPFLYFLPIILFVYFYPHRGVMFSLLLSIIYISLVYYYGFSDPKLIAVSTAWFVIFVTFGVVTSSFAESLRAEERKYQRIFENSQAGIFTFDCKTLQIKEINEKCAQMLKYERDDLIARDLSVILPNSINQDRFIFNVRKAAITGEVELIFHTSEGGERQFLVTTTIVPNYIAVCSAIDITERKLAEKVIQKAKEELEIRVKERTEELLRANEVLKAEIQERKRFEEAIQLANRKLNTLSSITRHDILNQITALIMYLSLAQEIVNEPILRDHLDKIEKITELIQKQIRFTRDYQNIGTNAPMWQNVQLSIDNAISDLHLGSVALDVDVDNLEIYADMLLEKVFYNLVENTPRHGEKVTKIKFYFEHNDSGGILICEDNGIGIPPNVKEKIFKREYYRNTGYGLFLVTEILSITGLSIKETGEFNHGARFKISIPLEFFRFTN